MKKDYQKNKFGVLASICLFIGIIFISLSMSFVIEAELIRGILFYGSIILGVVSLVLSIIGLIKDQKKAMSIITLIAIIVIVLLSIYCYTVLLPKAINETIDGWTSKWI